MMLPYEVQNVLQSHVEAIDGGPGRHISLRRIAEAASFYVYSVDELSLPRAFIFQLRDIEIVGVVIHDDILPPGL